MKNIVYKKPNFKITQRLSRKLTITYYSDSVEIRQGKRFVVIDLECFEEVAGAISNRKPKIIRTNDL